MGLHVKCFFVDPTALDSSEPLSYGKWGGSNLSPIASKNGILKFQRSDMIPA